MRRMTKWVAIGLTPVSLISVPLPAVAQNAAATNTASSPAFLCMSRRSDTPDGREMVIIVPVGKQADMSAKGYAPRICEADNEQQASEAQTKICQFATSAPVGAQDQFRAAHIVSAQELCDLATEAEGNA